MLLLRVLSATTLAQLEAEQNLAGHRALDQIAEPVLLHDIIQKVLPADGDAHPAIGRVHAEPRTVRKLWRT